MEIGQKGKRRGVVPDSKKGVKLFKETRPQINQNTCDRPFKRRGLKSGGEKRQNLKLKKKEEN